MPTYAKVIAKLLGAISMALFFVYLNQRGCLPPLN
jgi:hypothetical protein